MYLDAVDLALLKLLQSDATTSYTTLAKEVGLSAAAVHDRVRKLRERGVVRRTTVEVDPESVGLSTLAFVLLHATAWMGDEATAVAISAVPGVQEAHIVAGRASVLAKVRARSNAELQAILRQLYSVDGVSETEAVMVLETIFERSVEIQPGGDE
ncbi:MAG TPA: Lrp/AsnC family transcriptional regulator [Nocardioidaceae bacterium]|nr:Lrp/AsnC family transcriptional regulator [Nocardioidaceae bacterium]